MPLSRFVSPLLAGAPGDGIQPHSHRSLANLRFRVEMSVDCSAGALFQVERTYEHGLMTFSPMTIFRRNDRYEGVRGINVYLLRLVFILMFFVLGRNTWTHILTHTGTWEPRDAMAWCVWTAFATLAALGIVRPLKMLPILLLEIFYKVLWLILVAYPLWSAGTLAGSAAESTTSAFLWVILPIISVPWGYVFQNYIYKSKK